MLCLRVCIRYDQTTILDSSGSITSNRRRKGCNLLLPAATKLGQGNVFTGVCDSATGGVGGGGGGSASVHAGIPPPLEQTPPWDQTPRADTPAPSGADSGIWSTSGRYASYWNAFLFGQIFLKTAWKWRNLACILKLNFHWKHKVFVSLDDWTSTAAQIKISQGSCTNKIPVPVALVCAAGDCAVLFLCRPIYSLIFLFLHLYFVGFLSIWQPERTNIRMSLFSYRNCVQWFKYLALTGSFTLRESESESKRDFFPYNLYPTNPSESVIAFVPK